MRGRAAGMHAQLGLAGLGQSPDSLRLPALGLFPALLRQSRLAVAQGGEASHLHEKGEKTASRERIAMSRRAGDTSCSIFPDAP